MKLSTAVLGTAFACLLTQAARGQEFTLEQALSAPFATDLVPSPTSGKVAWMENLQGRRNLWVAKPDGSGKFTATQLTSYNDDDGQEMYDIAWTPDAQEILYVRGGDAEFPGRPDPNPTHATEGVSQNIYIIPATSGEPRKMGE